MTYNPAGFNLAIYHSGRPRQVEHVELGERRMVVKMTMSEYHLLMKEFDAHIVKARGVGREEGVSLMEVLIVQLTSLSFQCCIKKDKRLTKITKTCTIP